jgi:hypothetical protein
MSFFLLCQLITFINETRWEYKNISIIKININKTTNLCSCRAGQKESECFHALVLPVHDFGNSNKKNDHDIF